jgi:hypothetical protein
MQLFADQTYPLSSFLILSGICLAGPYQPRKICAMKYNRDNIKDAIPGIIIIIIGWLMVILFGCLVIMKIKMLLQN